MWREKSKQHWMEDGDANTHFFHLATMIQRRYNSINYLLVEDDCWISKWEGIGQAFVQYYSNIFN